MANFGDITEPSSRAAWEDWDNIETGCNIPKLQWQVPLELPNEIGKFFIFEGRCLWSGVKAKKNIQQVNYVKEANLHLYKMPNTNNFVAIVKDCDLLMCNDVIQLLYDMITKSKMIVTIQEKPMSEYKSNQASTTPHIIRKITTTNKLNLMNENLPKLEQPNIVSGVSAGVFTLREHLGLSATAIVFFTEPQENQVEDIENLLQKMDMSGATRANPNAALNSNLYT